MSTIVAVTVAILVMLLLVGMATAVALDALADAQRRRVAVQRALVMEAATRELRGLTRAAVRDMQRGTGLK